MELKTPLVLYISVAVAVAFGIAAFIYIRRKKKYSGGKKAYLPEYLSKESIYKTRMAWYVVLKYVLIALIITSIILSGYLMARPFNGERFGIVIFNTSPVLLCPLTNDYQYIIRQLDSLKEGLQMRLDYTNKQILPSAKYSQVEAFLENGTLVGFPDRGSSIIGEGLAGAVLDFYDIEEKPDRTRIIIFTSDNENAVIGDEIVTLPEAGQWAKERGITVFGIGTEMMKDADRRMMQDTVEMTGGSFWNGEDDEVVAEIVSNLRREMASLDDTQYEIVENELPETPFRLLLLSISLMLLCAFVLKV